MADEFEGKDIRQTLDAWRASVDEKAQRPDWFWARQHARINARMGTRVTKLPKLAWASVAATMAIAASLLLSAPHKKAQHQPQQQAPKQVEISDHDLMIAIERSMNAGVPSSLAPATLLADEMNQALESQGQSQKVKESHYEN